MFRKEKKEILVQPGHPNLPNTPVNQVPSLSFVPVTEWWNVL